MLKPSLVGVLIMTSFLLDPPKADAAGEASFFYGSTSTGDVLIEDMRTFGGTVGAYSKIIGFELGLEYSPTSSFQVGNIEAGASLMSFMGNVVAQLPIGPVIPFGTVGYGVVSGNPSIDVPEGFIGTVGALNFGLGGRVYFTDHVGVRVDWRRFALQTKEEAPELYIPFTDIPINTSPKMNRFAVGVALRW